MCTYNGAGHVLEQLRSIVAEASESNPAARRTLSVNGNGNGKVIDIDAAVGHALELVRGEETA